MDNPEPGPLPLPSDENADPATSPDGDPGEDSNSFESLRADITALVDDARTYAEAEIAFQKTRAGLAASKSVRALALVVLALVLLHIALIALAVGAVIALAPLVTIWGAIAIVVGVLLAGTTALVWAALGNGKIVAAMFGPEDGA
ncbi:MAG: hypothetical protein CVT75_12910 [Alphaproteobacteria bacterium HGW-Alphaproteobacteria-14]|nr:MAG: hypothetical protein CVT75_12910 [Alphaproteobacteria bacterium HGW-Alphaproteobacteria-14]